MATQEVLIRADPTIFVIANSTYSPDANDSLGTITDDIDVVGLTTGQAREGVKIDLGVDHAEFISVDMSVEMATDTTAGDTIDLYWSSSDSATAAVGNLGPDVTGADNDYAGTGHGYTLAEALQQMIFIGSLILAVQNDADGVQLGRVGIFAPGPQRYGVLIWHNNSAVTIHSDSVESAVRFTPIIPDIQGAA